ncbi:hypothetical protein ACOMHN_033725 [Nucella lapillus]
MDFQSSEAVDNKADYFRCNAAKFKAADFQCSVRKNKANIKKAVPLLQDLCLCVIDTRDLHHQGLLLYKDTLCLLVVNKEEDVAEEEDQSQGNTSSTLNNEAEEEEIQEKFKVLNDEDIKLLKSKSPDIPEHLYQQAAKNFVWDKTQTNLFTSQDIVKDTVATFFKKWKVKHSKRLKKTETYNESQEEEEAVLSTYSATVGISPQFKTWVVSMLRASPRGGPRVFLNEWSRLASFNSLQVPPDIYIIRLASNGFFLLDCPDPSSPERGRGVECAFCGVRVPLLQFRGRRVEDVHREASPGCRFVSGVSEDNVSIADSVRRVSKDHVSIAESVCRVQEGPPPSLDNRSWTPQGSVAAAETSRLRTADEDTTTTTTTTTTTETPSFSSPHIDIATTRTAPVTPLPHSSTPIPDSTPSASTSASTSTVSASTSPAAAPSAATVRSTSTPTSTPTPALSSAATSHTGSVTTSTDALATVATSAATTSTTSAAAPTTDALSAVTSAATTTTATTAAATTATSSLAEIPGRSISGSVDTPAGGRERFERRGEETTIPIDEPSLRTDGLQSSSASAASSAAAAAAAAAAAVTDVAAVPSASTESLGQSAAVVDVAAPAEMTSTAGGGEGEGEGEGGGERSSPPTDTDNHEDQKQTVTYEDLGIFAQRPKRSDMAVAQVRIQTFTNWQHEGSHPAARMAEAGFYYTGHADLVRCFYCRGGLKTWEQSDQPWVEHCRWFPRCPYVRLAKGQRFVDIVQRMTISNNNDGTIKPTIREEQVTEEVQKMEEEESRNLAQASGQMVDSASAVDTEDPYQEVLAREGLGPDADIDDDTLQELSSRLEEEAEEARNVTLCKMCQAEEVTVLFLPCGHLVACAMCAPALRTCAICRQTVKGSVRVRMTDDVTDNHDSHPEGAQSGETTGTSGRS